MEKSSYHSLDIGKNVPNSFKAVVEIPRESRNKYEIKNNYLTLDRVLHSPLLYPTNYGFIPQTKAKDGDALDTLIWTRFPLDPRCIVSVRPIGILEMRDEEGIDNKILAVPTNDPFFREIKSIKDVQNNLLREMSQFFRRYKELEEEKTTQVKNWYGKDKAKSTILEAKERYEHLH